MANVGQNKINFRNQQDPSAKFISRDMMDGWEISDIDAEGWHQVNASTDKIIQEVTEDVGNGETLELFTTALAVKGKDIVGSILKYGASGDAQIVTTWQYFDSKDTTFDGTGAQTGGEWVDFGTESASSTPQTIDAGDTKFADIVRTGSKLRLKLTITDSGGNGVTASSAYLIVPQAYVKKFTDDWQSTEHSNFSTTIRPYFFDNSRDFTTWGFIPNSLLHLYDGNMVSYWRYQWRYGTREGILKGLEEKWKRLQSI